MLTLTLIVVGFLVATGLVVALARGSTARWEQSRRSPVAARPAVPTSRTSPVRSAVRTVRAMTRRGVSLLRKRFPPLPRGRALHRRAPKDLELDKPRGRPIRRLVGTLRSWRSGGRREVGRTGVRAPASLVDGHEAGMDLAPDPPAAATDIRRSGATGATRRALLRRTTVGAPRRVLALLHRKDDSRDVRPVRGGGDERPTARS